MKAIINNTVKLYLRYRMRRIEHYAKHPEAVQQYWLQKLLRTAANTSIGRTYRFSEIKDPETFAARVPTMDYNKTKGYINRMMHGEQDVLWPGEVTWYAKSSGTTSSKSKFIPVPRSNLYKCHVAGSWDSVALLYHNKPDMEIFKRKNLILPGSYQSFDEHPRTKYGDVSAVMVNHMPAIGRGFYCPDFDTALQSNFEKKIQDVIDISTKRDDIVMFGGVPTWIIVLFRMILEKTGKDNMLEVWPHLQAYMHGGVGFGPYRETFKRLIPSDDFVYQEIYNASEGYFGAQSELGMDDLLLFLDNGMYFEFVPMEEWHFEHPKAVPIWEVELGKNYALVVSTNAGLWRYMPGDTVIFTSKYPYKFKITGRTKQFINAFGEELMVSDADKALAVVSERTGVVVTEYTAGPIFFSKGKQGGHEWIVEFENPPNDLDTYARMLDEALQGINSDYEAKRFKSLALQRLQIHQVPKGTFHEWMRSRGKYGNQNKVPRLANNRKFVEELLRFVQRTGVGL